MISFEQFCKNRRHLNEMAIKQSQFKDYDEIDIFDKDYLLVKKDGLYNLSDRNGKLVSDVWFENITKNSDGSVNAVATGSGNKTYDATYSSAGVFKACVDVQNKVLSGVSLPKGIVVDVLIPITPYPIKRADTGNSVTIIAKVELKGKSLLLGKDGRLYTADGREYNMAMSKGGVRPTNKEELKALIKERIKRGGVNANLNDIDVSQVTDMSSLFCDSEFNGDISKWNVGNVKNMWSMFAGSTFNGDISGWNVSNVEYMGYMFSDSKFNDDISKWNVSRVINMEGIFCNSDFNGDISKWDVSNVECMGYMFSGSRFTRDISQWDVSIVTDMEGMFYKSEFNGDISKWDVSNVKNMSWMFMYSAFNGDISKWNVSKVDNMVGMFRGSSFNGDIGKWDVSNVTGGMFGMFTNSPLENNPPKWYKE